MRLQGFSFFLLSQSLSFYFLLFLSCFSFSPFTSPSSMKFQASELPLLKQQSRRKTPKIAPLVALAVLLTIIPIYYPWLRYNFRKISEAAPSFDSFEESIWPAALQEQTNVNGPCSVEDHGSRPCNRKEAGGELEDPKVTKRMVQRERPAVLSDEEARSRPSSIKDNLSVGEATDKKSSGKWPNSSQGDHPKISETPKRKRPSRHQRGQETSKPPEKTGRRRFPNHGDLENIAGSNLIDKDKCDLFSGEWVPNPEAPYYTNETCFAIQEHQNCMKFGRPDSGFLKWKWKPDGCELPVFDPNQFLEVVRGKSIAFVGDSVARNHMQSLICLLSRVAYPVDLSNATDQNKLYEYRDYNFKISIFWAPYLVRVQKTDPEDAGRPFNLYLDEFDEKWRTEIKEYDYVIISAGHWFFRPTNFYVNGRLVGCLYCPQENVPHLKSSFSYRRAFRTALRAIYSLENFKGVTFLRTFAPSHFENGPWDKGGDCVRTKPFKRNETTLEDFSSEMYIIQLQEFQIAQREARRRGLRFRLFDATKPMLLRPDGHPSKYGHWPQQNVTLANDCVHWCLPGPIDTWNDFLLELLKRVEPEI